MLFKEDIIKGLKPRTSMLCGVLSFIEIWGVSSVAYEKKYMEMAVRLAHLSALEGEVPAGAVIVKDGQVIATGRNRREKTKNALAHAELEAIDGACRYLKSWRLSGCDLYVTLEPCLMCGGAIINARIRRVYFGAYDIQGGACGSVIHVLAASLSHKPDFEGGHEEDLCQRQLSDFFKILRMMKEYTIILRRFSNIDYEGAFPLFCLIAKEVGGYDEIISGGPGAFAKFLSGGYPMVAVRDSQVVAFGSVDIGGEIRALGVLPDLRGKMIGMKVLYSLEEKAKNADKPFVWTAKQEGSRGFFTRCGYDEQDNKLVKNFFRRIL